MAQLETIPRILNFHLFPGSHLRYDTLSREHEEAAGHKSESVTHAC